MFELIFGLIWTLFSSIFVVVMFLAEDVPPFFILIIALFIIIGVFLFIKGLLKVIKNIKTNKYGEVCYGYINNIYPDGSYVNGSPEYKADIYTYIPSTNTTENISEIIGFDSLKYPVESYIVGKYYEGDINIEKRLDSFQELPLNAQYCFNNIEEQKKASENIIIINGQKYQKIDENNK